MVSWAGMESVTETQEPTRVVGGAGRFFYSYIFYFRFLQKKYIFDLEIYRNIPRPSSCRAAGTWPPGSGAAGAFVQKLLL